MRCRGPQIGGGDERRCLLKVFDKQLGIRSNAYQVGAAWLTTPDLVSESIMKGLEVVVVDEFVGPVPWSHWWHHGGETAMQFHPVGQVSSFLS
jgi:hypothetical protein